MWYPLLSKKFFDTPNFLKNWRDAHQIFRHCEPKTFRRENVIPPFSSIKFLKPKILSETLGFSNESFGHCETKKIRRKNVISLLCIKFFDTPNFLKHWRVAPEIFRHCETKIIRRRNVMLPFSSMKLFQTNFFLKNSRILWRKFSAVWDQNFSTEKRDTPPFHP